jgi:hypothetical protein
MAKTFNQFKKKIDELYWPKAGDEAKFMAMHGTYAAADVGGKETHDDAVFKGTIVQKDHTKLAPPSEDLPDGQSELNDLIKNIHSRETDELLKTVAHLNLSTDPKHRESRDVINKELMYRYKNHSMSEELIGGQKNLDADGDKHLTAKDFAILRARKNKKKMNEELGFKPVKVSVGPYVGNERDQGGGHHVIAHGPNGEKKNVTQWTTDQIEAGKIAASTAKEHGLKPDRSKPFGHFIEESELDEGKFGNAMAKFTDKSKAPFVSKLIHGLQTRSAASAAKKSKADPDNYDKFSNYANARKKVREENEVDETYGSGMKYYAPRRRGPATSPLDRPDVKQALNKPRVDNPAIKDIVDKIHAKFTPEYMKQAGDNAAAARKRQVDAEKKKRGIAESDNKSRKIAGAIMRNEDVSFNTEEIELEDGNVIEIDIELAEAIADLFDSLDEDEQDVLAEMLHSDIDSFMEVVGLLEDDGE